MDRSHKFRFALFDQRNNSKHGENGSVKHMPRYFFGVYFRGDYVETVQVDAPDEKECQRYAEADVNPADEEGWELRFQGEVVEFDDDDG